MKDAVEDSASTMEQLTERIYSLEDRVSALEARPVQPVAVSVAASFPPVERPKPPGTWRGFPPAKTSAGTVPIIGKAVLGIAGAYFLRAIAESGVVPRLPILLAAILYAGSWMAWAIRGYAANRTASITYAVTSVLIFCPLMWESTVRFHVLGDGVASLLLLAFVLDVLALSWLRGLEMIPFLACFATAVTSLALIAGTGDFVPFCGTLLGMVLAVEVAASVDRQLRLRSVPAISVDLALALLLLMKVSPQGIGEGFRTGSAASVTMLCLGVLALYGASIGFRAFYRLCRLSAFETVQVGLAFLIGAAAVLAVSSRAGFMLLGGWFLLLAAFCYWGALSRFVAERHTRNRRISASWAALLLTAGTLLMFPFNIAIVFLCLSAVCASYLYSQTGKFSLGLHATLFLTTALVVSPLPMYIVGALALTVPAIPSWLVWALAVTAAVCYGVGARRIEEKRSRRVLWVVPALVLGFTLAAVTTSVIKAIAGPVLSSASALSVIRTAVDCILALVLGFLCLRQRRVELGWVAYMAVGFGTLKLLFEDMRFGDASSLVISFLFYGSVLILLPRLTRSVSGSGVDSVRSGANHLDV